MTKIKDFSERSPLTIATDKVCELILHARAIDVKEGQTIPIRIEPHRRWRDRRAGGNAEDATEEEFREVIVGLNDDERVDLIALVYIGRGDMEPGEWSDAVRLAREREAANVLPTADWLLGIPNRASLGRGIGGFRDDLLVSRLAGLPHPVQTKRIIDETW